MIRMIVGRCHVGETYREVIRYVISRLADGKRTFKALSRSKRKEFLREIVKVHRENRAEYRWVMGGCR